MYHVTVDIKFGQTSKDCLNFGICKMAMHQSCRFLKRKRDAVAILSYNRLEYSIEFLEKTMNSDVIKNHFHHSEFTVLEDFIVSKSICMALKSSTIIIPKRIYTVKKEGKNLKISVPLRKRAMMQ